MGGKLWGSRASPGHHAPEGVRPHAIIPRVSTSLTAPFSRATPSAYIASATRAAVYIINTPGYAATATALHLQWQHMSAFTAARLL